MEILVALVLLAGVAAAGIWGWMSRSEEAETEKASVGWGDPRPPEAPETGGDFFVLFPSDLPVPRVDRPSPALSLARLALAVAVTTALLVAVAWLIGFVVKVQLDSYFSSGT